MRIPHTLVPALRASVVGAFTALCALIFGFLWVNAGGSIPLVTEDGYQVQVSMSDVDNLVYESDVRMAGVDVGTVKDVSVRGPRAQVRLQLNPDVAPLHQGATITVRNKTLIEETYLEVTDGSGKPLPNGSALPRNAARASVQLDDVLADLDRPTRASLRRLLRSTGTATAGRSADVADLLEGLGYLGREGGAALSALSAQSRSLSQLTASTTAVLQALDSRRGAITHLVADAQRVTGTVSANRRHVAALMRSLPPLLATTSTASRHLHRLAGGLAPVAANLDAAAPDLSAALRQLPATSTDLRRLVPDLNRVMVQAPATLQRVPGFVRVTYPALVALQTALGDLNPMLTYLRPYGHDLAAFFTNFGQYVSGSDANGHISRVMPVYNEKTPNSPVDSQRGMLRKWNPYPKPFGSRDPSNFTGRYPRVEQEGRSR